MIFKPLRDKTRETRFPAVFFLYPALLFGTLFVFLIPPFQSPDEPNHFFRAWQVGEGHFFPEKTADQRLGGRVPESLLRLSGHFVYLKDNYAAQVSPDSLYRAADISLFSGNTVFHDFANTAIYAPTAYLPQAAAIRLMRFFETPPIYVLYAARWANLLTWTLLVWAALRKMPFFRRSFAALALLPASLVMAASANADVLTNGLVFWLVAGFCNAGADVDKSSRSLKSGSFVVAAIVCANKLIVWPLLLLAGLFPNIKPIHFITILSIGLIAAALWGRFSSNLFIPYDSYHPDYRDTQTLNEGVDPARQLAFITAHPFEFIKIAGVSLAKAAPSSAAHFVGKFGWEKNYLPGYQIAMLWLALLFLAASEGSPVSKFGRTLAAVVVLLFIGLFCVAMYLLWHPVGAAEMGNFQGRYFVPAAPAAVLAAGGLGWFQKMEGRLIQQMALLLVILGNIAMIFSILNRYWMA